MTEYQLLLEAVEQYYGAGSDQWLTIATSSNIQSAEWASVLRQTPGVNVITNNAGEIVSYTVNNSFGTVTDAATSAINSNAQAASMAGSSVLELPSTTTVTQTGTVAAESGMKTVASGASVATVLKDVALGVAAVGIGIQAGAKIDQTLYDINPDWWNEHGMSSLNPQTWDSICTTKGGKNVMNMVFGIDKNTGTTQAYMDANAVAYITQYLASIGIYDGIEIIPDYDDTGAYTITSRCTPDVLLARLSYAPRSIDYSAVASELQNFINTYYTANKICMIRYYTLNGNYSGSSPLSIYISDNDYNAINLGSSIPCHVFATEGAGAEGAPVVIYNYNITTSNPIAFIGESVGTEATEIWSMGVTQSQAYVQPGATVPQGINDTLTIPQVLAILQQTYPDMFNNAIYDDVVQDDGSVKRYTYLPVGIPEAIDIDEISGLIQPKGGTLSTQQDDTVTPTSPEDLINTLLKILTSPDPNNPTGTPTTPTTQFPDTGEGTTPSIVTPIGSASALYSVYNPTQAQLNSLGAWLWSSNFVDQILKLFNDPMQAIIGLHKIFATPPTSGTGDIKVGYLDSGVSSKLVSSQYTEVNCGSVNLREYFGNTLDYTETDVYLYLPFIGIVPLNVVDVMRSSITVVYKVDVLTGACLANVNVQRDNAGGQLYTYAGNCAVQYPLSSGSYMGIVAGALGIAGSIAGTIVSGGAVLPMALGAGAAALTSAKTKVEHSGSLSGNAGAMGIKKPYLIIRRPQTKIAENFQVFNGEANNLYNTLIQLTGFTKIKYINPENIPATGDELAEIVRKLKEGVII